jgi:hypothetical protein
MKHLLLIISFCAFSFMLQAQTTITGVLRDSLTQEPEPYATIRAFKAGKTDKPAAMALTSDDGTIKINIKTKGDFIISISSVGKKEVIREVTVSGEPTLDLGTVYTTAETGQLAGVEVVAAKPIVTMETDRMSYSVKDDADSQTMTVLDMLRKVPMVTVDAQDNITVNGSGSFKILVDGKPNMQLQNNAKMVLKMMPASVVEKIEVITNPGAKYDAEGVGGVLDLKLKHGEGNANSEEVLNGHNGEVSLRAGNINSSASLYLGGQQGKFTYNFNLIGAFSKVKNIEAYNIQRFYGAAGTSSNETDVTIDENNKYQSASLSMGYELDSLSNINASVGFNNFSRKQEDSPFSVFSGPNYGSGFSYYYDQTMKQRFTGMNASADYQRFFNKERTRNIAISYQFSNNPSRERDYRYYRDISGVPAITFGDTYSNAYTRGTEHIVQADYTTPIGKGQTVNAGAKFISHLNKSDSKFYNIIDKVETINPNNSILYENKQRIGAAYAEYAGSFGKFTTREGLRYEHTWENIDYPSDSRKNFKKDYGTLVPSATLSYSVAPMTNIGLNYNMRILRPGISYLNPYINKSNPTEMEYGNPDLCVEKSHSISLVFNTYSAKFMANATLSQSFCNNQIAKYSFTDNNNILNTTFGNIAKNKWTNFNTWMRYVAGKKTTIMVNGYVGYGDMRSAQLDAHNYGWEADGMIMLEQTLPWAVKMNLGVQGSTKKYNIQGYSGGMSFSYIVLTKTMLKDRLTLSLFGMTPLSDKLNVKNYTHSSAFENITNAKVPIRMFQFTVSWKFGNSNKNYQTNQRKLSSDYGENKTQDTQMGGVSIGQP